MALAGAAGLDHVGFDRAGFDPVALDALRRRIADVGGDLADPTHVLPTGLAALDAALRGGLPRGRITELLGAPGSGKTTLARQLVAQTLASGAWVAYVDATRTLAPHDWAALGTRPGEAPLWVVRPADGARAAWCADVLLRSGAFGLVVVDGAPVATRAVAVRLLQLARDADAALLLMSDGTRASDLGGALRLRADRARAERRHDVRARLHGWRAHPTSGAHPRGATRRFVVTVEKGGTHRTVEVACAIDVARRLCAHPEVPDRRDVAGAPRHAVRTTGGGGDAARAPVRAPVRAPAAGSAGRPVASGAALRRARRCAEPEYGRA